MYRVYVDGQEVTEKNKPIELTIEEVKVYNTLPGVSIEKA